MKKTVYLIRHSKVENPKDIFYGRLPNFHLSLEGIKLAREKAEWFRDKNIGRIISSPLERCSETAEQIGRVLKVKMEISFAFLEVRTHWDGYPNKEVDSLPSGCLYIPNYMKKGDETLQELTQRVISGIETLVVENQEGNILVVSHQDPVTAAYCYYRYKDFGIKELKSHNIPYLGVVELEFDGTEQLVKVEIIS